MGKLVVGHKCITENNQKVYEPDCQSPIYLVSVDAFYIRLHFGLGTEIFNRELYRSGRIRTFDHHCKLACFASSVNLCT
jgi:hypothetical protein